MRKRTCAAARAHARAVMPHAPVPAAQLLAPLAAAAACGVAVARETVLITGASGQTGSLLYELVKADTARFQVRGLVLNRTKAQGVLSCGACGEADGIYVGDVRNQTSLTDAMRGVDRLVITVGVHGGPPDYAYAVGACPVDITFRGAINQVAAAAAAGVKGIIHVSAGLTTHTNVPFLDEMICPAASDPTWATPWAPGSPSQPQGGQELFYKLNAEAKLMAAAHGARPFNFTIVKPRMLASGPAGKARFVVNHEDGLRGEPGVAVFPGCPPSAPGACVQMQRADLAALLHAALREPALAGNLRFGVSTDSTRPAVDPPDFAALFTEARGGLQE